IGSLRRSRTCETWFPYTTLFRSRLGAGDDVRRDAGASWAVLLDPARAWHQTLCDRGVSSAGEGTGGVLMLATLLLLAQLVLPGRSEEHTSELQSREKIV